MPRSHQSCQISFKIFGTFCCISSFRMPSILCSPERSRQKSSAQAFHFITPISTQNTRQANSSSIIAWPASSLSFSIASNLSRMPPMRFMPWVQPLLLRFTYATRILLSYGRYFVTAQVLFTSLSMVSISPFGKASTDESSSKFLSVNFFISLVFASTSHTFLRILQSMPLKTEKQRSFFECPERSEVLITSLHSQRVSYLPQQRLPISKKSLMYIFSTPYCSYCSFSAPRMMKSSLGGSSRMSSRMSQKLWDLMDDGGLGLGLVSGWTKQVLSCLKRFIIDYQKYLQSSNVGQMNKMIN